MKRTGLFLVAIVCMLTQSMTCFADDDKFVPIEQLPADIHFIRNKGFRIDGRKI